ncbi:TDT family transporter [Thermovenabulum sp.]|uniref:TDT family transporter n=1 Tax=Thermovenabulum sp. TaxID=3100335 RepID=UPI003C7E66AC
MKEIINKVPIPISGLMLALASLGNFLSFYGTIYKTLLGTISFSILFLVIFKILLMPEEILKDLENPLVAGVAPTFFMGIMILSTYIKPYYPEIALILWSLALVGHILYILFFTKKFIFSFDIKKTFPSFFVVYVGIAAAAIPAPSYGMSLAGRYIFWFAFISYLLLLPVLLFRIYRYRNFPEPALPSLAIFTAPANLCITGYMSSFDIKNMNLLLFLFVLSSISFIGVLFYLPRMLRIKFYPSFSCFTFPFVITAIAVKNFHGYLIKKGLTLAFLSIYVNFLTIIAVSLVTFVLFKYIIFLFSSPQEGITVKN